MVLNQQYNPEYEDIVWTKPFDRSEFMVIHMLGVHNDFVGRGLAKEMVRFAIETAGAAGMKAIRLDVLKGNVPAERLYPAMGVYLCGYYQAFL
jgi:ribosomal protein S18 acetylase RimI-like enzyme